MLGFGFAVTIGLVLGVVARLVLPHRDPGGVFLAALLGVAGAVTAWLIGGALGWYRDEELGVLVSTSGALALLVLHRVVVRLSG
jgi:uncharacterized membrane protein YeaQ/YmgE (transglycosylase-associated protein family)